jgi:tetratricopeptide (TPR) repeat protein
MTVPYICISTQTESNPPQSQLEQLVGELNGGNTHQAEAVCRELLVMYPHSFLLMNILGVIFDSKRNYKGAVQAYDQAISLSSGYAEAYNNRALSLKALGEINRSISDFKSAINHNPKYWEAYLNLGVIQNEIGKLDNALESFSNVIKLAPSFPGGYYNAGIVSLRSGESDSALHYFEQAIKHNTNYVEAYSKCGLIYKELCDWGSALVMFNSALSINDSHIEALYNKGYVLNRLGKSGFACDCYRRVIELNPDQVEAHNNLGSVLKELGDFEAAIGCFETAINIDSGCVAAYSNLCAIKKFTESDSCIGKMKNLLHNPELSGSDKAKIHFSIAKACDDIGNHQDSFDNLIIGNNLRKEELSYSIEQDELLFQRILSVFDGSRVDDTQSALQCHQRPIFIVGMPRSGTSLVEQIIASHTEVYGAGELTGMGDVISRVLSPLWQLNTNNCYAESEVRKIRDGYVGVLEGLDTDKNIVVDKMPLNFRVAGVILQALPNAKIINMSRGPVATCWSSYKVNFSSVGNGYSYDLSDLADYYHLYKDLMEFWYKKFPGKIYDLHYEKLTENQEDETRKLLEYCELSWKDACLDFHKNMRAVKTASSTQVRQKMYTGSSEAWRKYEKHLHPLLDGLRKHGLIDQNGNSMIGINPNAANGINFVAK